MRKSLLILVLACSFAVVSCSTKSSPSSKAQTQEFASSAANPMLWRATLATMKALPVQKADRISGIVTYDWGSFEGVDDERIKATVYILDTRLRADAIKVALFKEVKSPSGAWVAADTDSATAEQLEARILELARLYSLNSL